MSPQPTKKQGSDVVNEKTGQSWVYSPIVKDHFFHPRNLLLDEPKDADFDARGTVGSPACGDVMDVWIKVDPETERLTDFKWKTFGSLAENTRLVLNDFKTKPVNEIKKGDVLQDGEGKINIVEQVFKENYRGNMLKIRLATSAYYTFQLTPNHPIPVVRRDTVASVRRFSEGRWAEISASKLRTAEREMISAADLQLMDFLLYEIPKKIKDNRAITIDYCVILGYYVSDGNLPSYSRVVFKFNETEDEYAKEILVIAKKRKWSVRIQQVPKEHVQLVIIYNARLVSFLRKHGGSPNNKQFSETILALPPKKQWRIIESYVHGDGWTQQENSGWEMQYFIGTHQEQLALQLQSMIARNNIFAPIHYRTPRKFTIRGKTYTNSGEYNIIFRKNPARTWIKYAPREHVFLIPIRSIEVTPYEGSIYDIGLLEKPNTYRINGVSIHNCGSAISATSMFSVMLLENGGATLEEALKVKPQHIMERLGGLPNRKIHCSVLVDKAFRKAVNTYFRNTEQYARIINETGRVVDEKLNITDHDIEEAVLEGATTLEEVQKKLKVGVGSPDAIPDIEQLIRFYSEKYYG